MSDETAALAPPVPPSSTSTVTPRRRLRLRLRRPKADIVAAVVSWLVGTPIAVLSVRAADLDPFTAGGAIMPVALGSVVAGCLIVLWLLTRSELVIGLGVGALASWVALTIAAALNGTPFGVAGLFGDAGRLATMATRFTTTWHSADGMVHNLPTEYPPLYPWLIGHVANILDRPAWQLMGDAQIVTMSAAIVLSYVMWRLLVGPRTAFVIVALALAGFAAPNLDYEVIALLVLIPWALATFGASTFGPVRLHWLPAGIIGGLIVLMYPGFLGFSMLGILTVVGLTLRSVVPRRDYLLHLVGVTLVAFVIASWYLVPYFVTSLAHGGNKVSDLYLPGNLVDQPLVFPFLAATPIGLVQLVGLFGLFWYRRSWWGLPLLAIGGGVVVYRVIYLLRTVVDGHTGFLAHTVRLISAVLIVAGVLTVVTAAPAILARLTTSAVRARDVASAAVVVLVAWSAVQAWQSWMPGPRGIRDAAASAGGVNLSTYAHTERRPDGRMPKYAPPVRQMPYFPANDVDRFITSTLGADAKPVVLSYSQRLYAYFPYYGFATPDRTAANSLQRWDERRDSLDRLAAIREPAQFAQASAHTGFGPIDVFVLRDGDTSWSWGPVHFRPASFGSGFKVEHLPGNTVVAVRLS